MNHCGSKSCRSTQGLAIAGIGRERRRVWQAEAWFYCPLAGMCLSLAEQRRLCAKVDQRVASKGDFYMHEYVVANLGRENPLSRLVDGLLARKYAAACRKFLSMDEGEFLCRWRDALGRGDFAAELWAAAVRPELSHAARVEVFGSCHVAMHELAKQYPVHTTRLEALTGKLLQAKVRDKQARQDDRRRTEETELFRRRITEGEASLRQARAVIERLTGEFAEIRRGDAFSRLHLRCAELEAEGARLTAELELRTREAKALAARICELEAGRGHRPERLAPVPPDSPPADAATACTPERCSPDCPSFDLCRKRVLIVGGMSRMEDAYRRFVEERGGIFEYHDGRLRGGAKGLESSFRRADVVLCPVNCNSHGACLLVKNLGKKHRKPVHMLPGFGLATVSRAVAANAN